MDIEQLNQQIASEMALVQGLRDEVKKVIVGQPILIDRLIIALISGGHVLLEGVPGLAKTLTIKCLANSVQAAFKRIQFTPDLLPADLMGTLIYNHHKAEFFTKKGPIFANIILADEINRAPAKVQSALLEAMQEGQVTIGDETHALPKPFFVLATQNPIEQEGTYPLPEAQVDRFMMKVMIDYPDAKSEREVLDRHEQRRDTETQIHPVMNINDLIRLKDIAGSIYMDDKLKEYIVDIVASTRSPEQFGMPDLKEWLSFGASPRASIALMQGSKAMAMLLGRGYVIPDDIKVICKDVLRHRIIPSYEAQADGKTPDELIERILREIVVP